MKGTMKRGICLVLVVCMLLVLVPGTAVASETAAFTTEPMVAAGYAHNLVLRRDGTVWGWGANWDGQLGDGTGGRPDGGRVIDMAADRLTPVQTQNLTNVTAIAAGGTFPYNDLFAAAHSVALKDNGTVWAWGSNLFGQLGNGTRNHWVDDEWVSYDSYTPAQVPNLNNVTAIAAGDIHTAVLRDDGTVWTWGDLYNTPTQVPNLNRVTAIAAGSWNTAALRDDGTVWTWGDNWSGQLGNGTIPGEDNNWEHGHSLIPVQVQNLTNVIAIAAGNSHIVALRDDGTVWAWGDNWRGQLGDGTNNTRTTPVQVQNLSNVTAITAGIQHTAALRDDGTVWAWGNNAEGQLGTETDGYYLNLGPYVELYVNYSTIPLQTQNLTTVTAITAGWNHSIALKTDGSVWAWGQGVYGQLGDGIRNEWDDWGWDWSDFHHSTTPVQVLGPDGEGFLNLNPTTAPHPTFPDVLATHWGHPFVEQAYARGFMRGVTGGRFDPYGSLTRAQVAQIMVNMADVGTQPHPAIAPFSDVPAHAWYAPVIAWAAEQNIMNGHADGTFGPGQPITREQFAVVMRNFAAWQGYDVTSPPDGGTEWPFPDNGSISWWAADALRWANYHGIILGSGGNVLPTATSMRVQAATIVVRFDDTEFQQAP
ncbi:MAG: S-layer homology domain-containing protein [Oscillospiraceae bacterium]|nr:S-layer homology domain-containing protein [Oscillospiraceae bacterium]